MTVINNVHNFHMSFDNTDTFRIKFVYMIDLKLSGVLQDFLQKLIVREKSADIIRAREKQKLCLIILKTRSIYCVTIVLQSNSKLSLF